MLQKFVVHNASSIRLQKGLCWHGKAGGTLHMPQVLGHSFALTGSVQYEYSHSTSSSMAHSMVGSTAKWIKHLW